MSEETINNDKTDSIKLSKTSTGKYSWEIKKYFNPEKVSSDEVKKELDRINLEMCKTYPE